MSASAARQREFPFTQQDFDFLRRLSNQHTGIVVSDDKFDMFYSRLARRVRALRLPDFASYCDYLRRGEDPNELTELINAVTTNLTAFFRENHHFEYLRDHAIPERMQAAGGERRIRIWSAGCSTGEEPYSLGMTVGEMQSRLAGWQVEISATDIDSDVVAKAKRGVYRQDRVEGLPPERLKRWFLKGRGRQQGMVRVKPELRERIDFGLLNLMQDWRREPQDIIFCRNVIIYFDKESKRRLIDRFADTIKPGGFLFIGHSESLFQVSERFELIGKTIYRRVR
ncbi:MAG TPA: chemotaxis protein CheR [Gammaproteobacteria bacterium]|nr:chemotaxis protein CheR [Gammaproteobacteria bacterium]